MKVGGISAWGIFIVLALIWGSSFILMKEGLKGLSAVQVASLRIFTAGIILLPLAIHSIKKFTSRGLGIAILCGFLGNLFPAFLFCIAEEKVDSSLAGMLNSLTPIFATLISAVFFRMLVPLNKIAGILIALVGTVILFLTTFKANAEMNLAYASLIVLATFFYGLNANIVAHYLKGYTTIQIASVSICTSAIVALAVLIFTGYFKTDILHDKTILLSTLFSAILGIFGTALATILYFRLIVQKGVVFSSLVTYAIPFVALLWGLWYGEKITWMQILALIVILAGVGIVNLKAAKK